ncbi:hypothetical protein A3Q56_03531 [Intoshia linei]|uniref:Uncharacterized protein n=1 Tax=Intoshia linei TaxID=1819745 RepID=A0A177B346_9BILA|nr:hypothetical protein A3Q56_03531 [Intoshia linei]
MLFQDERLNPGVELISTTHHDYRRIPLDVCNKEKFSNSKKIGSNAFFPIENGNICSEALSSFQKKIGCKSKQNVISNHSNVSFPIVNKKNYKELYESEHKKSFKYKQIQDSIVKIKEKYKNNVMNISDENYISKSVYNDTFSEKPKIEKTLQTATPTKSNINLCIDRNQENYKSVMKESFQTNEIQSKNDYIQNKKRHKMCNIGDHLNHFKKVSTTESQDTYINKICDTKKIIKKPTYLDNITIHHRNNINVPNVSETHQNYTIPEIHKIKPCLPLKSKLQLGYNNKYGRNISIAKTDFKKIDLPNNKKNILNIKNKLMNDNVYFGPKESGFTTTINTCYRYHPTKDLISTKKPNYKNANIYNMYDKFFGETIYKNDYVKKDVSSRILEKNNYVSNVKFPLIKGYFPISEQKYSYRRMDHDCEKLNERIKETKHNFQASYVPIDFKEINSFMDYISIEPQNS